jgi:hypothetical protein
VQVEHIDEGQGLKEDDGVKGTSSRRVQEKRLGINELILRGEVQGVHVQQKVKRTEE